jgi:O-antigen/teichoic acid export membrane protein
MSRFVMDRVNNEIHISARRKGVIALIVSSYSSIALSIIKGIVLVPVYLYYIDDRLYGAWLATGSIIAYFGLLDFGLNGVLVQRIASNYGKEDIDRLGSVLGTGVIIGLSLSSVPLLLGILISPWITDIVKITSIQSSQLRLAFILAAVGASLMLTMYCVGGVLIALQRQIVHGTVLFIGDILGIVAIVTMLMSGYGLIAIPLGTLVWALFSALIDGLYLWWFVKKKLPQVSIRFNREEVKDLCFHSVWQFGARSASTASRESDNLIVGALLDPRLCTVLTFTRKASDILAQLVKHIAGAFLPGLSHLHGEDDKVKFKKITLLLFKITSLLGICLMGSFLFLNEGFIKLWVGSKYYGGFVLTSLFCIYGFFVILATTFYNVIFAKGEMITTAKANLAEAFLRIPLCIVFVWLWGIKGAAIAAALAIIPTSFWIQAKSFIKVLHLSRKDILTVIRTMGLQILVALTVGIMLSIWKSEGVIEFFSFGGLYIFSVLSINTFLDRELRLKVSDGQKRFLDKYFVKGQA